jgi:type I restriction enzyme S subunit
MSFDTAHTLRDFVSLQRGTTYKGSLLGLPGPVLLGLASIQPNGGFRRGSFKTYGGESPPKISLRPGEIYVSLKDVTQSGDLLGSVARIPADIKLGRLTQDTVKLEFCGKDISQKYVYWLLRTPVYRAYCRARGTGTTTLGLGRDDFLDFPVQVPDRAALSLVDLLEALDERITLLHDTNATLEAIATALFKSWFIDFDPVRAKKEGREPDGMNEATAALFPDDFEESALGLVPRGWSIGTLEDLLVLQRGFDLPAPDRVPGAYQIIAASGPSGTHKEAKVNGPGVVTGRSGVLGRVFLELGDFWPLNTSLWVKEFKAATPCYAYEVLRLIDLQTYNAGSAVPTLNRNHIHVLPHLIPNRECVKAYEELALQLHQRVRLNQQQAASLTAVRDSLLPRLISGQLRLPDVEKFSEPSTGT